MASSTLAPVRPPGQRRPGRRFRACGSRSTPATDSRRWSRRSAGPRSPPNKVRGACTPKHDIVQRCDLQLHFLARRSRDCCEEMLEVRSQRRPGLGVLMPGLMPGLSRPNALTAETYWVCAPGVRQAAGEPAYRHCTSVEPEAAVSKQTRLASDLEVTPQRVSRSVSRTLRPRYPSRGTRHGVQGGPASGRQTRIC